LNATHWTQTVIFYAKWNLYRTYTTDSKTLYQMRGHTNWYKLFETHILAYYKLP